MVDFLSRWSSDLAGRSTVLYAPNAAVSEARVQQLTSLGATVLADMPSLLRELTQWLDRATMGTRLYVTGNMAFIGEVALVAARYGVSFASLRTEHRGRLSKRVQCVHCKTTQENVVADSVICSQCKLRLFVRDHYSHRLNAFMGVAMDAETGS